MPIRIGELALAPTPGQRLHGHSPLSNSLCQQAILARANVGAGVGQRVCGKPRSTLDVAGSGQREVTCGVRKVGSCGVAVFVDESSEAIASFHAS